MIDSLHGFCIREEVSIKSLIPTTYLDEFIIIYSTEASNYSS